jgi:uncharacterized protein DUF4912
MNGENSGNDKRTQPRRPGFRISGGPVVSDRRPAAAPPEYGMLPSSYGAPILFAIPRDPQTIFTYWNIDWSDTFARNAPADRRVYLRLKRQDGSDEIEEPIEPMLGTHFLLVSQPKGTYQVELGFYDPADTWNSVGLSDAVTMPSNVSSDNAEVDLATVPVHLSFQRMIDLFRAGNGNPLTTLISDLQDKAGSAGGNASLSAEEQEILRAMDVSLEDLEEARRGFSDRSLDELLRKRAEAVLGFGGTSPAGGPAGSSPAGGFGGSSWASGL